jgi:hypothetical protein
MSGSLLYEGPLEIDESTMLKARAFWGDGITTRVVAWEFTQTNAIPASPLEDLQPGLVVEYYEHDGSWDVLPDFDSLIPTSTSVLDRIDFGASSRDENFGLRFRGFLSVPEDGVYGFYLTSDDGSRLSIGGDILVDHDGIHGAAERSGFIALAAGAHPIELVFFQRAGGVALALECDGPGFEKRELGMELLFHRND